MSYISLFYKTNARTFGFLYSQHSGSCLCSHSMALYPFCYSTVIPASPFFHLQLLSFFSGWDMTCYFFFFLGWSNHFVSKRKYHIIIPMDDEWHKPLEDGICDLPTHLLHGLIHCNGYAHLVCVNGLEGGSKHLCGREIMDLWDRVCTNLRTR